jgi:putative copper export protein
MSDVTITSRSRQARAPGDRRIRLSRGQRKAALVAHIVCAGAWVGIDVIVAVLVLTGRFGGDPAPRSLAYRALATFVVWPMLAAGLLLTTLILATVLAVVKLRGRIRRPQEER